MAPVPSCLALTWQDEGNLNFVPFLYNLEKIHLVYLVKEVELGSFNF